MKQYVIVSNKVKKYAVILLDLLHIPHNISHNISNQYLQKETFYVERHGNIRLPVIVPSKGSLYLFRCSECNVPYLIHEEMVQCQSLCKGREKHV